MRSPAMPGDAFGEAADAVAPDPNMPSSGGKGIAAPPERKLLALNLVEFLSRDIQLREILPPRGFAIKRWRRVVRPRQGQVPRYVGEPTPLGWDGIR